VLLFTNTFVSLLIKGPLKVILDSIKQLQIIVHVLLINVAYPATATVFFGMLMQVLTFQFADFTDFYNHKLNLDPDSEGNQPLNDHFDLMGYSSLYLIQNFGTMCWSLLVVPTCWLASVAANALSRGRFVHFMQKLNRMMFYDYWLSLLFENYIFLAVCASLNFMYMQWQTYGDAINSFLTVCTGISVVAFPIFVALFYNLP
jgi:hypothetical protein